MPSAAVLASPAPSLTDVASAALNAFAEKARKACFIDYVIGCCLANTFALAPVMHWPTVQPLDCVVLVGALAITRCCDAAVKMSQTKHVAARAVEKVVANG